jgi:zinc transport system ATP-binding protein
MTAPVIEVDALQFRYNGNPILENVNLKVDRGEFLGIIGPNGGGKSTLLKLILGLLSPDQGVIKVLGTTALHARRRMGYCPQYGSFERGFPITVSEAVHHARLKGWRTFQRFNDNDHAIVARALADMGLDGKEHMPIADLSGGQLQRVLIARALACEPEILLLDEPVAHVDPPGGAGLFDKLKELSDRMTILVVSHDIGFISSYVNRVACVNHTLDCHYTADITGEVMDRLYGNHVKIIDHHHGHKGHDPSIPSLRH